MINITCTAVILVTAATASAGDDSALGSFAKGSASMVESLLGATGAVLECRRTSARMMSKERFTTYLRHHGFVAPAIPAVLSRIASRTTFLIFRNINRFGMLAIVAVAR